MTSDSQGYTAAQYLEAGYRAEQGGERDRAAQYYHYVAEAFPETPEAEAARGGLVRIGAVQRPAEAGTIAQPAPGGRATKANWTPGAAAAHSADGARNQPYAGAGSGFAQYPASAPAQAQTAPTAQQRIVLGDLARLKLAPAQSMPAEAAQRAPVATEPAAPASDAGHGDPLRLPDVVTRRAREIAEADAYAPVPKYRGGRFMARVFVWLGWLVVAAGLASIVVGVFALPPDVAQFGVGIVVLAAISTIVGGLVLVLLGQLALAVFDGSNAVREIAAFMRARQHL